MESPNQKTQSQERKGFPAPSALKCLYDNIHTSAQQIMAFSVPSPEQGRDRLSSVDVRLSWCQGAGVWRGVGSDFQTHCTDRARVLRAGPSAPSLVPSEQTSVGPAMQAS